MDINALNEDGNSSFSSAVSKMMAGYEYYIKNRFVVCTTAIKIKHKIIYS